MVGAHHPVGARGIVAGRFWAVRGGEITSVAPCGTASGWAPPPRTGATRPSSRRSEGPSAVGRAVRVRRTLRGAQLRSHRERHHHPRARLSERVNTTCSLVGGGGFVLDSTSLPLFAGGRSSGLSPSCGGFSLGVFFVCGFVFSCVNVGACLIYV